MLVEAQVAYMRAGRYYGLGTTLGLSNESIGIE
jgi:hypothetical protein